MKTILVIFGTILLLAHFTIQQREVEFEDESAKPSERADDVPEFDDVPQFDDAEAEDPEKKLFDSGDTSSNHYIDKLLDVIKKEIRDKSLDPLKLPEKVKSFQKKLFWKKTLKGGMRFDNGFLKGLSTIHRRGDTDLSYVNDRLVLLTTLGFNDLHVSSDLSVWFSLFKINTEVAAEISSLTVHMKLSQNSEERSTTKPMLENLDIKDVGKIKTSVKGLGALGWTLSKITSVFANLLREIIANKVEVRIEKLVRKNLHHFDFDL